MKWTCCHKVLTGRVGELGTKRQHESGLQNRSRYDTIKTMDNNGKEQSFISLAQRLSINFH